MRILRVRLAHRRRATALLACLLASFGLSLILEAMDSDPDLFAMGAEDQETTAPAWVGGASLVPETILGANVSVSIVLTGGIHLIAAYRARSALATDNNSARLSVIFTTMAERGGTRPPARPIHFLGRSS